MTKLSPLQRVRAEHGTKAALVDKVVALLSPDEGEEREDFENRIKTLSNDKLLRLYSANQRLEKEYGSREALVDAVVKARFPNGNAQYKAKVEGYRTTRLLDLAR